MIVRYRFAFNGCRRERNSRYGATKARTKTQELCRKLHRWANDNDCKIGVALNEVDSLPEDLDGRKYDTWEVMMALANLAGGVWPKRCLDSCRHLIETNIAETTYPELLIGDLAVIFDGRGWIKSTEICDKLNASEERPWKGWNKGKGFDTRALSRMLKPFNIAPAPRKQADGHVLRGYSRAALSAR